MGYIGQAPANKAITSADIEDGVISAADLGANSVDSSELVDGSIDLSHLSASGTKSSSTYFRGDNSFATISAGTALTGSTDNTIPTVTGANAISGETNLTYNGTILGAGATGASADLGVGVHIRTADSGASVSAYADELVIENSDNAGISLLSGTSGEGNLRFGDSGNDSIGVIAYMHSSNSMQFKTSATEYMRIHSNGNFGIGTNPDSAYGQVLMVSDDVDTQTLNIHHNYGTSTTAGLGVKKAATTSGVVQIRMGHSAPITGAGTVTMQINDNGNIINTNNSYGQISDERIKQNITDSNSQWDDIKSLKIKNFKLKEEVRRLGAEAKSQIGVVAQDVEATSPNLISEIAPMEQDVISSAEFGTVYEEGDVLPENKQIGDIKVESDKVKTIKYSVLYMKAIKCLQEAQTRIETLEDKVTALENA